MTKEQYIRVIERVINSPRNDYQKIIMLQQGFELYVEENVEPVIHAEWVKGKSGLYSCSHCDATCPYDVQGDVIEYWDCPRCPKCGAIMNK